MTSSDASYSVKHLCVLLVSWVKNILPLAHWRLCILRKVFAIVFSLKLPYVSVPSMKYTILVTIPAMTLYAILKSERNERQPGCDIEAAAETGDGFADI